MRELIEEAGVEVKIKRFLGCLEYRYHNRSYCHDHEYNFVFEVESEHLKLEVKVISPESKMELVWMPIQSLTEIDFRAAPLKFLIPKWLNSKASNCFQSEV